MSDLRILRRGEKACFSSKVTEVRNRLGMQVKLWRLRLGRSSDQGFVVCRPRGGLNDTLNQLAKTFVYAYRHQRRLLIDTTRSGLLDEWSQYFEVVHHGLPVSLDLRDWRPSVDFRFEPAALQMRGLDYLTDVDSQYRVREADNGQEITFNMDAPYPAQVLVHEQFGGGLQGWIALHLFRFNQETQQQILQAISDLPPSYTAIHIRHSDVKTDYRTVFQKLRAYLVDKHVVVCTDSAEVQNCAQDELRESEVLYCHRLPFTNGVPIHGSPGITSRTLNINTFTDLITLARSDELILTMATPSQTIWPGRTGGYPSGFGLLAADLFRRRYLLSQLLTSPV